MTNGVTRIGKVLTLGKDILREQFEKLNINIVLLLH